MKLEDLGHLIALELIDCEVPEFAQWISIDNDGWIFVYDEKPELKFETRTDHENYEVFFDFWWNPTTMNCLKVKINYELFNYLDGAELASVFHATKPNAYHEKLCWKLSDIL